MEITNLALELEIHSAWLFLVRADGNYAPNTQDKRRMLAISIDERLTREFNELVLTKQPRGLNGWWYNTMKCFNSRFLGAATYVQLRDKFVVLASTLAKTHPTHEETLLIFALQLLRDICYIRDAANPVLDATVYTALVKHYGLEEADKQYRNRCSI